MRKQRLHENLNNASDLKKNVEKKFMHSYKEKSLMRNLEALLGYKKLIICNG
jgi:hypothetical protein